ncbi:C2H2 type master regulator of conidiophore development brlA [Fusarium oxysporum f. sp. narcissi]|uniref:C2H2 type master regulator of conidiophore development brlA n=1 Tax=Fusarium oxysporum f. sp. narcissi TaxID=451672 RepID=A0A4Q2V3U8_FUSOX|nr:C2H2 type master regulator of conidiophore development brlA [Fusarium oxysporum f. sp. narcissi]
MDLESDYRFDMDDAAFSLCSQPMSCPSTTTSFSSASSAYDPFTPTPRRSTPDGFSNIDFGVSYSPVRHRAELTPPPSAMGKFMFGPVKPELEHASFFDSLPSTPMNQEQLGFECEHMMDMNMAQNGSMGSLTPQSSFGMYSYSPDASMGPASFTMTPMQSISGSEAAETGSSWCCANDSTNTFFPIRQLSSDFDAFDLDHHSQSLLGYHFHDLNSPNYKRAQRKLMVHEIQQKSAELKRAQTRSSRKRSSKPNSAQVNVQRAMCKCDYSGCYKAFQRNEHLKRHKQVFHGEGPNRFSCEFCGKDQFNRQDNLNNHRRLHARPNSRNRGVQFIPAAVPVIEQEERSRKRRAPSKPKMAKKHCSKD